MKNLPLESHDEELTWLHDLAEAVRTEEAPPASYARARSALLEQLPPDTASRNWLALFSTPQARFAFTAATLVLIAVVLLNPFGGRSGQAFAAVTESLRQAATIAFSAEWRFTGSDEPTVVEIAFRKPGLQRTVMNYQGAEAVQIYDTEQGRGIVLIPTYQIYTEMDLTGMPSAEHERTQLIRLVTEGLVNLPREADETLDEDIIGGRTVHGYRAGRRTLWIDEARQELVQMDLDQGGYTMVLTDFRLDPPEFDDSAFNITPPEGYAASTDQAVVYDVEDAGETDLITFLQFMSAFRIDSRFPSTINPMEVLTLQERGLFRADEAATLQEQQEGGRLFAEASQRAVVFVSSMGPEQHWHYAGDGVVLDTPDTPIAWWQPAGSDAYRVLWADLTATDEADWDPTALP